MADSMRLCLVVAVCLLSLGAQAMEESEFRASILEEMRNAHPIRVSERTADPLEETLADKARLFVRSMDADHDRKIGSEDIYARGHILAAHLPGVTPDEFNSFIALADTDQDGKLDDRELLQGLSQGLETAVFVETDSQLGSQGFFQAVKKFVGRLVGGNKKAKKKARGKKAKRVDESQDACIICQYVVERAETNVKQAGIIPAITGASQGPSVFLETGMSVRARTAQTPFDTAAASIIGATRQSTRYQRQLERQKYNEIYRVMDITLDDVCEQGMPNRFYGYCLAVYQMQSDIVDGLRYQYRPTDICYRVNMCGSKSYITFGIHSRYKKKAAGKKGAGRR